MEIYLLSILDGLGSFASGTAFFLVVGIWIVGSYHIMVEEINELGVFALKFMAVAAILLGILGALIPNRKDLIESYLIIEGKDIATTENVETIVSRIDDLIEKRLGE